MQDVTPFRLELAPGRTFFPSCFAEAFRRRLFSCPSKSRSSHLFLPSPPVWVILRPLCVGDFVGPAHL